MPSGAGWKPDASLAASLGLHFSVAGGLILGTSGKKEQEWIAPDEFVTVALAADLGPENQEAMRSSQEQSAPKESSSEPKPTAPADPNEMVEKQDKKEPEPKPKDRPQEPKEEEGDDSPDLSAMMKKLKGSKDDESADEDAPEGARNQRQTSTTGERGSTGIARQSIGDPALARYVDELRRTFTRNFHPIQSEPLQCMVSVQIDDSGRIQKWKVVQGSGNASFDSAALRSVMQTRKVPAPPEQFLDLARQGLTVQFAN